MKRKEAVYKGLQYIDVWVTDTSLTSPEYFQISEFPSRLTSGKNLFKLRGNPTNLKVGSYLNIEILDYNGDPIYHEIVNYIDEDKSRVIAIYIYEDTSPGDCTITLLGEAVNAPQEWQGRSNIKWMRSVPVNPTVSNDTEIIFETLPTVTLSEQVATQLDRIYPNNTQFPTYSTGTVRYFLANGQPAIELTGGTFTSDMSTGTIIVTTPQNPIPTATYLPANVQYQSTIKKILSPTTALLDTEYIVYSSQSISSHTYTQFANSSYLITYEASPTYVPTENSESFAFIEIKGLQPATGDVSRIKTFMNNNGQVGTWELINDVELTETEVFITSTSSLYPDQNIGIFTSQSIINTYWEGHTYQGLVETTAPTLTWTTASINNAMQITNAVDLTSTNTVSVAQIKSSYSGLFIANGSYKITFDALGVRTGTANPKLSFYLSGSAFNFDVTDYFNRELYTKLGKRVGEIEVTSDNQRFDDYVFNFQADNTGNAVLLVVVEAGNWQVADIRTTTDNDAGYTPDYTRIRSLVPTAHKIDNQLSFKVEYYNVAGVKSKQINYIYNKNWEGGNRYIDGDYSMLTGSLYIADSLESGIALTGNSSTGFARSLGYEGFDAGYPGFLLWSGSALPGQTSKGLPYSGVGLELYANTSSYFRYSTSANSIDVRTDNFFFGQYPAPFISGANGNIEISASNFHLSQQGDVTASNALFTGVALANIIRDKTVTITTANSSSYLQTIDIEPGGGVTNATRIVMDGSLGGEIIRRVRINCALLYPIGDFALPNLSSTAKLEFTIETNRSDTTIYDVFTPAKTGGTIIYPPNSITLDQGAAVTFVAGGASGNAFLSVAGTETPFDHTFKSYIMLTGSNNTSFIWIEENSGGDPVTIFVGSGSGATKSWVLGVDSGDAASFKISNATSFASPSALAMRIDTNENVSFAGDVTITGSVIIPNSTIPIDTAWTSYTPIWSTDGATQPVIGNGSITGAYKQIGKTVFVRVRLAFGSTTTGGTGAFYFSLPVSASIASGIQFPCSILDNGNAWYQGTVNGEYGGFTDKTAIIGQSAGGANSSQGVTSTFPIGFGTSDSIQFNGSYEAS